MNREQAIELLKKYATDEKSFKAVLEHVNAVTNYAMDLAKKIFESGYFVDLELIETGCLLHDIGRFSCPPWEKNSIMHGVKGAEILNKEKLPNHALIAERHIGAGISVQDIEDQKLPLPKKDYLPRTIEEKIITYADKMFENDKLIKIQDVIKRFKKEVNENCAQRIKQLHLEMRELAGLEPKMIKIS